MSTHGTEVEGSPELIAEDGWALLETIVRLARAGMPYKDKLPGLKMYVERDPELAEMIRRIVRDNQ